mmetsp:Transcript_14643/g.55155  ORF Transcript_14643/g.55155 Transcript_14643/m.55155 type:complete len:116 (+) Transcript_14643:55-402(+)
MHSVDNHTIRNAVGRGPRHMMLRQRLSQPTLAAPSQGGSQSCGRQAQKEQRRRADGAPRTLGLTSRPSQSRVVRRHHELPKRSPDARTRADGLGEEGGGAHLSAWQRGKQPPLAA